jgi:sortase A
LSEYRNIRDRLSSAVLRGGDALIAIGLGVLLATAYNMWFSNILTHRQQVKVGNALHEQWERGIDPLASPGDNRSPDEKVPTIKLSAGIAMLYVPRLGRDFHYAIVQGSTVPDADQLAQGPAHYADTQLPGQVGNFALAGHRAGHGEPFIDVDRLRSGDAVIVETRSWWYVYRVLGEPAGSNPDQVRQQVGTAADGSPLMLPGREIVAPDNGNVVLPVPDHPGATATKRLMTMTTCWPKYGSTKRMIIYSELVMKVHNVDLKMPASVQSLYADAKS